MSSHSTFDIPRNGPPSQRSTDGTSARGVVVRSAESARIGRHSDSGFSDKRTHPAIPPAPERRKDIQPLADRPQRSGLAGNPNHVVDASSRTVRVSTPILRIGVFIDRSYLLSVSEYYRNIHERHSRISPLGLAAFIQREVAILENVAERYCRIVQQQCFGGLPAMQHSQQPQLLEDDLPFEDELIGANAKACSGHRDTRDDEKKAEVEMILNAYVAASRDGVEVVALVADDSCYEPLVRQLNAIGTRSLLLVWRFSSTDTRTGQQRQTTVAETLIQQANYVLDMTARIDLGIADDPLVKGLFARETAPPHVLAVPDDDDEDQRNSTANEDRFGTIGHINPQKLCGSIREEGCARTWLFLSSAVRGVKFHELRHGQPVVFSLAPNPQRPDEMMAVDIELED